MAELTDFQKFIKVFADELNELEFVAADLKNLRSINTATGAQLDIIGEIVGLARGGSDDNTYRTLLRAKVAQNVSNGEPENVIALIKLLTASDNIAYTENYPAAYCVHVDGANIPINLRPGVEAGSPAGVQVCVTSQFDPATVPFVFEGEGGQLPVTPGEGFGETGAGNELDGGQIVERIA